MRPRILDAISDEPANRAGDRRRLGVPAHEALVWVMGMRRYGYAPRGQGRDARRLLPVRAARDGSPMTTIAPLRRRSTSDLLRRHPALRRGRRQRLLQLRDLHRDLPAGHRRRDVPAPDDPLRPAGPARRAPVQQGAVDLLRLRRVLRELPARRPSPAEFMAAARRYAIAATTGPAWRGRCPPGPIARHAHRGVPGRSFFALFMYAATAPQGGDAGPLRVHPGRADPQPWASSSWSSSSWPGWPAWHAWPADWPAGACSVRCARRQPAARLGARRGAAWTAVVAVSRSASAATAASARPTSGRPGIAGAGSSTPPRCGASSACSRRRSSTTAWPWSGSRQPARRCRSGTRSDSSGRSPGLLLVYGATILIVRSASAARSGPCATRPPPTGRSWRSSGSPG